MKRTGGWPHVSEVDYSVGRAQAIRWLGDRYLLARPINWNHCAEFKVLPLPLQSMPISTPQRVATCVGP